MAKKRVVPALPDLTTPTTGAESGGGGSLFQRVNPFVILVGMGFATLFTWYLTGGGRGDNGRRPTHLPEFGLGEEVGGQTITGVRTRWEYEVDDEAGWLQEESL